MSYKNGHDNPNVASLEEARKRAADKLKAEKRAAASAGASGGRNSVRDWIFGLLVIAMALGYVGYLVMGAGSSGVPQPIQVQNK